MEKTPREITKKEKRFMVVFNVLKKSLGHEPTIAELTRALGYKSPNSTRQFMNSLNRKGVDYRKVDISTPVAKKQLKSTYMIPIVGSVACGTPLFADENIEDYLEIDSGLIRGNPKDYYILRARGKSMDKAGIDDSDLVLVKSQSTANPGDRVVALIGDEATIKFFKPMGDYVALLPKSSDPAEKPIILSNTFLIRGVVKQVIKKEFMDV